MVHDLLIYIGVEYKDLSMVGADYLFVSVKGCQLSLVIVDAQKLWPVYRNGTEWFNASMNSLPSLATCFSLKTFREILIPHDINSAHCSS